MHNRHVHGTDRKKAVVAGLALLLVAAGVLFLSRVYQPSWAPGSSASASRPEAVSQPARSQVVESGDLSDWMSRLQLASVPDQRALVLAGLRTWLAQMSREEAIAMICAFLDTGKDCATGFGFHLQADGSLSEAPTFRVFLLDRLTDLDPNSAAAYADRIFESYDSADEWAVCFRACARANPGDKTYLENKLRQLLEHEPWRQSPSTGYLEAFDVAVYLGKTNLVPQLCSLLADANNPVVARAAYLAIDRLVLSQPAGVLQLLQTEPSLMTGRELTRSGYFSRADVRDPNQLRVLEEYLLRASLAEVDKFAAIYPNANFMVSHNLLTQCETPDHGTLKDKDSAALAAVKHWQTDPKFDRIKPQLGNIRARLEMFARQGN